MSEKETNSVCRVNVEPSGAVDFSIFLTNPQIGTIDVPQPVLDKEELVVVVVGLDVEDCC